MLTTTPDDCLVLSLVVRAALFIVIAPGTLAGWLPWDLAGSPRPRVDSVGSAVGLAFGVLGWLVLLWCARDFAVRGRGTPAPYDPPRRLVVDGLYRYVRNPMYVALIISLLGQAALYRSWNVIWYALILGLAFHLRVRLYEEPKLRELFGHTFEEYAARVPRWLPALLRDADRGKSEVPSPRAGDPPR